MCLLGSVWPLRRSFLVAAALGPTARGMSSTMVLPCASAGGEVSLLCARDAAQVDVDLMGSPGFSIDQLMELAGLSCASAVADAFPPSDSGGGKTTVLVLAGPGNNGGDGLVCARHLTHFGYNCAVVYPKVSKGPLFANLVKQLEDLDIPVTAEMPALATYGVLVDALFGFSFTGPPREPFATMLTALAAPGLEPKLVSIDVPSGWDVDEGPPDQGAVLRPDTLISLTAPKLCARHHRGSHHYLGGRFVPPHILQKYDLRLPPYPGSQQFLRL